MGLKGILEILNYTEFDCVDLFALLIFFFFLANNLIPSGLLLSHTNRRSRAVYDTALWGRFALEQLHDRRIISLVSAPVYHCFPQSLRAARTKVMLNSCQDIIQIETSQHTGAEEKQSQRALAHFILLHAFLCLLHIAVVQ